MIKKSPNYNKIHTRTHIILIKTIGYRVFVFITAVKKEYRNDNVNTTRDKVKRQREIVLKLGSPEANMNVTCDTAILFIFFKDQTVVS